MKKKIIALLTVFLMMFTCFVPATQCAFGASNTNSDGTYAGTFPQLPNAIAKKAIELAWPKGTASSKSKYGTGEATEAFKEAIDKAYKNRSSWGAAPKVGASCDVFAGTVIRASGYDGSIPRGLGEQTPYLTNSSKWTQLDYTGSNFDFQPGDVVILVYNKGTGHILIYVEIADKGYIAEASYKGFYGKITSVRSFNTSSIKSARVFRPTGKCITAMSKGDRSQQVKYLQQFLNWAGFNCGTADGEFGTETDKAVKAFQEAVGLEADGKFGSASLAAAKNYVKGTKAANDKSTSNLKKDTAAASTSNTTNTTKTNVATATKKAYTGSYPSGTISKKKGSRENIKKWQKYLKWYGYSITTGGTFGTKTIKYTKAFQKENGITADGIVGSKTIAIAKTIKK